LLLFFFFFCFTYILSESPVVVVLKYHLSPPFFFATNLYFYDFFTPSEAEPDYWVPFFSLFLPPDVLIMVMVKPVLLFYGSWFLNIIITFGLVS
jgi:hypothetical protein